MVATSPDASDGAPRTTVCLLGGPYLVVRSQVRQVPECAGRVLAYVTLHGGRVARRRLAGLLWPDASAERAAGNLRSSLWRLRSAAGVPVLEADKNAVRVRPGVTSDVDRVRRAARRTAGPTGEVAADGAGEGTGGRGEGVAELGLGWWHPELVDLLPGWDEEWVVLERERLRQQALHLLEHQSGLLVAAGRHGDAIEAALLAVEADPLRESAHRRLVEAHLAEGNLGEARREVEAFESLLRAELGLAPSARLRALV